MELFVYQLFFSHQIYQHPRRIQLSIYLSDSHKIAPSKNVPKTAVFRFLVRFVIWGYASLGLGL